MDILDYPAKCIPLPLSPTRCKESYLPATPEERTAYQSLAGTLNSTERIRALFPHASTPLYFELRVDAKGLYDTITTLHESKDYRLRPTVARLRDSFGAEEIRVLRWIPGDGLGMVVDRRLPPTSRTHESRVWQGLYRLEVEVVWILRGATGR
jgi:hypothetical protein